MGNNEITAFLCNNRVKSNIKMSYMEAEVYNMI